MNKLPRARSSLRLSDVRGAVALAADAAIGVSHIVEGVHQSVLRTIGIGQSGALSGLVYGSVRGVANWLGRGAGHLLAELESYRSADPSGDLSESPRREAVLAVLNGVMGDRLAETSSPLATPMQLRRAQDQAAASVPAPAVSGKLLVFIHGLCMNERGWRLDGAAPAIRDEAQSASEGYTEAVAAELGYTPLYLRYNSGRHISENGRELAALLETAIAAWPVPVKAISVVAHSMGGLVIRSAVQLADENGLGWRAHLKNIVFLGTPHHGAPLERGGNVIDSLLGMTPYTAPFARLGRLRSAGITDLRYGYVVDADWHGQDRFHRRADTRCCLPLPENVACFTLAATTVAKRGLLADRLLGDGLVPLRSALGEHADARHCLQFARASKSIVYRTGHNALLWRPEVGRQVLAWLQTAGGEGDRS